MSETAASPSPADFKAACCSRFGFAAEAFERKLLRRALPPLARPLCALVRLFDREFFQFEMEFIRRVGRAHTEDEVETEVGMLPSDPQFRQGFLRRCFGVRISGRRLLRLAGEVLG